MLFSQMYYHMNYLLHSPIGFFYHFLLENQVQFITKGRELRVQFKKNRNCTIDHIVKLLFDAKTQNTEN